MSAIDFHLGGIGRDANRISPRLQFSLPMICEDRAIIAL